VLARVSQENTTGRAWREFVVGGGVEVRVAKTPKHSEMVVGGRHTIKAEMRGVELDGTRRTQV
jgi:hypothetical protein